MSGSLNKVTLIGNLGKDPETRAMQSGDICVNLSIATTESWKDKTTGEKKENVQWHRITIWNQGLARIAEKYLKKGSKIYIEGQLETRKWTDKDGVEKYTTEIVLRPYNGEIIMLSGKINDDTRSAREEDSYYSQQPQEQSTRAAIPMDDMEDEIPF